MADHRCSYQEVSESKARRQASGSLKPRAPKGRKCCMRGHGTGVVESAEDCGNTVPIKRWLQGGSGSSFPIAMQDISTGGFRPYDPSKGHTPRAATAAPMDVKPESSAQAEVTTTATRVEEPGRSTPSPSVTPSTALTASTPAASASMETKNTAMPPASGTEASAWTRQNLGRERAEWAGDMTADAEPQHLGQRLESIGQRPSVPSQRLESLAGNLTSMMSSSNGAPLEALRALSSINSSGIVPAFGQLAQRGALGGYPATMLQQPGMQQYLSNLPWMLRMQGAQGGMANLFSGAQMGSDGGAHDGGMSGGLPLSEADGMPSLSGMSPSDAAAFLQSNKKRKAGGGKSPSSGENHMKYSDDEGDGVGMHDDLDDMDGGDLNKVKRRLAQNREAARKSRQRRKQYVQSLEEEVRALRAGKSAGPAGQPLGSGNSSSLGTGGYGPGAHTLGNDADTNGLLKAIINRLPLGSLSGPDSTRLSSPSIRSVARGSMGLNPTDPLLRQNEEVLQAFDKWRSEHTATVLSVRRAVNDGATSDAALRPLVEEARGQLWTLFAMKKAVICSESVLIIMNMEHLLPAERLFAWLGGLRASDICGGLLAKLSEHGMANGQRMKLEALRESLLQQENTLSRGYNELLQSLGQRAAAQSIHPSPDKRAWDSPDILGKLDAMRMTLLQADSVWEQFLEQTERFLTMRQYAMAVIGLMETSLQLQNLHQPWLALLRRPVTHE